MSILTYCVYFALPSWRVIQILTSSTGLSLTYILRIDCCMSLWARLQASEIIVVFINDL